MYPETTARLFDLIVRSLYEVRGASSATPAQWALLRAASLRNNPRRTTDALATYLGIDASDVQAMIDRLIHRGWLTLATGTATPNLIEFTELGRSALADDPCAALAQALARMDGSAAFQLSGVLESLFDTVCEVQVESGASSLRRLLS